jgi:alcohol dehydrogenase
VVADITVHGQPAGMQLAAPWSRSVSITTRRVDANALQKAPPTRRPGPARPIAHRFRLEKILDAYETFGRAAASRAPEAFVGA